MFPFNLFKPNVPFPIHERPGGFEPWNNRKPPQRDMSLLVWIIMFGIVAFILAIGGAVFFAYQAGRDNTEVAITALPTLAVLPENTAEITPEITSEATMEITPELTMEASAEATGVVGVLPGNEPIPTNTWIISTSSNGLLPTYTPLPTYTLLPTYTPAPPVIVRESGNTNTVYITQPAPPAPPPQEVTRVVVISTTPILIAIPTDGTQIRALTMTAESTPEITPEITPEAPTATVTFTPAPTMTLTATVTLTPTETPTGTP